MPVNPERPEGSEAYPPILTALAQHLAGDRSPWTADELVETITNDYAVLHERVRALEAERDRMADFLIREGYQRCDSACNCGEWHGSKWQRRHDECREERDAAEAMVIALCKPRGTPGAREWTMSIPADPTRDPDLVIGDALHAARELILARPDAGGEARERVGAGPSAMLCEDNRRMREAGNALAEAALRVIRTYDGTHRLAIAVAEWAQAVADEGGRAALRGEEVGDG